METTSTATSYVTLDRSSSGHRPRLSLDLVDGWTPAAAAVQLGRVRIMQEPSCLDYEPAGVEAASDRGGDAGNREWDGRCSMDQIWRTRRRVVRLTSSRTRVSRPRPGRCRGLQGRGQIALGRGAGITASELPRPRPTARSLTFWKGSGLSCVAGESPIRAVNAHGGRLEEPPPSGDRSVPVGSEIGELEALVRASRERRLRAFKWAIQDSNL